MYSFIIQSFQDLLPCALDTMLLLEAKSLFNSIVIYFSVRSNRRHRTCGYQRCINLRSFSDDSWSVVRVKQRNRHPSLWVIKPLSNAIFKAVALQLFLRALAAWSIRHLWVSNNLLEHTLPPASSSCSTSDKSHTHTPLSL